MLYQFYRSNNYNADPCKKILVKHLSQTTITNIEGETDNSDINSNNKMYHFARTTMLSLSSQHFCQRLKMDARDSIAAGDLQQTLCIPPDITDVVTTVAYRYLNNQTCV